MDVELGYSLIELEKKMIRSCCKVFLRQWSRDVELGT